jgi:hypothetical protein
MEMCSFFAIYAIQSGRGFIYLIHCQCCCCIYGIDAVPSLSMKEKTQKEKREGKKLNFITNNKW